MKVVLELQDQPSNIKKVTVRHDVVIGRGAECNLRLSAPQVSRRHCFLRISGDSATITDLDSSNGTYLNGKRITSGKRYSIEDGAQLGIGPVQFTARVHSEVPASELLEVNVNDDRIETESSTPPLHDHGRSDSATPDDLGATVADPLPEDDDRSSLNFAIETGGAAAHEDDPTADYLSPDAVRGYEHIDDEGDVEVLLPQPAPIDSAHSILGDWADSEVSEPETVAVTDDTVAADQLELIEDEVEVIEVLDEETVEVVPDEDELQLVCEEDILLADEDEILVVDDDEVVNDDVSEVEAGDSVEDELRDFLKGLD